MSKVDADVVEGASLQSHRQHLDFQLHLAVELLRLRHGNLQHAVTVTSNTSTIRNIPDPRLVDSVHPTFARSWYKRYNAIHLTSYSKWLRAITHMYSHVESHVERLKS